MIPITDKPFPWTCGSCRAKEVYRETTPFTIEINSYGEPHTVHIPCLDAPRCRRCGELVLDTRANHQIDQAYRQQLGLLSPEEIRRGREKLNISPAELASRLRISGDTLDRLESGGQYQDPWLDVLLRQTFDRAGGVAPTNGAVPSTEGDRAHELFEALSATFLEEFALAMEKHPNLLHRLEANRDNLVETFLWLLRQDQQQLRAWLLALKGSPAPDSEGRWFLAPLSVQNKADGEYVALVRRFLGVLDDLPTDSRKKILKSYLQAVEAALEARPA